MDWMHDELPSVGSHRRGYVEPGMGSSSGRLACIINADGFVGAGQKAYLSAAADAYDTFNVDNEYVGGESLLTGNEAI